ncbi:UDP-N-acetylmuramoyl-tripeptide--D-alanyl-D-alanine ligase [Mycobacterium heckeshornense]|uniref:UDP-N-acetylmuramoyl-tripeptide--D-alanyl-D-alanine ligase n=1 Tax=Mycobacterium heckeshornense TaxID=110505 RepID=A0A2G8B3F3_9MYCO|nr:UDP-N-acetylmuramoyl-tripeptide--D-alanyl-D-alanine ligase [Mycobacterium heckeshornense]KMV21903.1 UDP-N-acetylmuramoyl-tripeptide--D-alanyl-D-alanine ligase [Mycobacterium heckeshornense]MCV7036800.1 UDP-N-acetylmuramoyl-tripeptide--D-alanyl-D-alanine ligase [Mycobacterium heckeshornense]PIJ32260.1 UDP-N-acetylmuramoyl-tripeptide--D-alanyl-D-alanine ligase [Mycobacterium heckeshornense]BCO35621.1 UDP-N-acetylmuramoyl-tripeptide--D-alanyl-D-alanine ligase [Mycobacterium heckeshornense]BCQ0
MIALTLAQIADIVGGELADISPQDAARLCVTGTVEFDSRKVTPGGLFLALPGARTDGHDYAAAAVAAGAAAVLAARPVGVPAVVVTPRRDPTHDALAAVFQHDHDGSGAAVLSALAKLAAAVAAELISKGLTVIGVTGSSGKTSTKDLLAAVLAPLGEVVAPPGSFNNELGHPWTVLRATPSTDYLVLELSARHPGNIAALAAIAPPKIGVVLNVGTAHLGEFGSREAIAATKAELPQAIPDTGVVILNADDPEVAAMADKTAARIVRVSRHPRTDAGPSDVWAGPVTLDELARPRFTLHTDRHERGAAAEVQLGVHGEHQVGNALCAAAVAFECGARIEQVVASLAGAGPVSGHRMHVTTRADGVTVIDDAYNANPDSMQAGLQALASIAHSRRRRSWAVLGEMAELGADAITEHDRVGRLAVRLDVSRLVVVGTGRSMSAMHHGAVTEGPRRAEATMVADAEAALALLRAELRPGDVVLIKASNAAGLGALADALIADVSGDGRGAGR